MALYYLFIHIIKKEVIFFIFLLLVLGSAVQYSIVVLYPAVLKVVQVVVFIFIFVYTTVYIEVPPQTHGRGQDPIATRDR